MISKLHKMAGVLFILSISGWACAIENSGIMDPAEKKALEERYPLACCEAKFERFTEKMLKLGASTDSKDKNPAKTQKRSAVLGGKDKDHSMPSSEDSVLIPNASDGGLGPLPEDSANVP